MSGIFDLRGYIGNLRLANMGQRQGDRNEIGRCPAALFGPYASWNVRFAPIVLKNSKIAGLQKSCKCSALAISAAARLCRIDASASDRFAVIDVVPHLAARETHQPP